MSANDLFKDCRLVESLIAIGRLLLILTVVVTKIVPTVYSAGWNVEVCFAMMRMDISWLKNVFWDINQIILDYIHEEYL